MPRMLDYDTEEEEDFRPSYAETRRKSAGKPAGKPGPPAFSPQNENSRYRNARYAPPPREDAPRRGRDDGGRERVPT